MPTVRYWFNGSKRFQTSVFDENRPGLQADVVIQEITEKVPHTNLSDRRTKVREIAEAIGVSKRTVFNNFPENFGDEKNQTTIETMGGYFCRIKKKSKDNSIFRKSYGDDFFFCGKTSDSYFSSKLLDSFDEKLRKRRTYLANKNFIFHFTNIPSHLPGVIAIILHELLIAETVAYFGGVLDNSHMKLDKFCDVRYWFNGSKRFQTSVFDENRPGLQADVVIQEITEKVLHTNLSDRRTKVREIAEAIGVSKRTVFNNFPQNFGDEKLLARWLSQLLTRTSN
ncbi:hypothetical protein LAZ67_2005853 [Cordylochernes scorpioides]|uniref:HTH tetR-type domain-containing protein n=1 Tax=Cordylochernes scorpioides TaxID=51811 RepID=A0ABY6K4R9_9ARAC|nr:hypothetical protein LAZ67_2005853 [Cordylochernes scorpioides]